MAGGDENTSMDLPQSAEEFLSKVVGAGHRLNDIDLADVINTVPGISLTRARISFCQC